MWTFSEGQACYSGVSGQSLGQTGVLEIGKEYLVSIEVSGMTKGQLRLDSFGASDFITEDGVYQFSGVATVPDLSVTALDYGPSAFDGCIEFVYAVEVPEVTVINACTLTSVYTVPTSDMSVYKSAIQVSIPWDLPDGQYYVNIDSQGINFISDCYVIGDHTCSILLSWTNEDNAYGLDYESLELVNKLRVEGKLWKVKPRSSQRDVFEFSDGSAKILYASKAMIETLSIKGLPDYLIRALGIGVDHDTFLVDGIDYIVVEGDIEPVWRNSSKLASVEIELRKKNSNLINKNCR